MTISQRAGLLFAAIPATILSFLVCLVRPFDGRNNKFCARLYAKFGLRVLNTRVRIEGWQHLPSDQPHVIIANHQSNLDLYVYGRVTPENAVAVGKRSLGWIPFFGQIFWLGGNVLIQRGNRKKAASAMAAASRAITEQKRSVWILPEGTRSRGRGLLAFRRGAFQTAIATGAPISIICFSDYLSAYERKGPHTVAARVLPPVPTAHLTLDDLPALMTRCRTLMIEHLTELNGTSPVAQAPRPPKAA